MKGRNRISAWVRVCATGLLALLLLTRTVSLKAQSPTASATLTITMNVQSSISLIFQDNPSVGSTGFCPLTNAGTNNVGLNLGSASFTGGDSLTCVAYSKIGGGTYQVSSAFDVLVAESNSTSPSYQLGAAISTTPPANVTWLLNGTNLTTTGFTTLDASDSYGTPVTKTLAVQVKNSVPAQLLTETVTFLATSN